MNIFRRLFDSPSPVLRPNQEPLLDTADPKRKRVYWLSEELRKNPARVELTRTLTLNKKRPLMGLNGKYGLFASPEWWSNINHRMMPLHVVTGVVLRAYEAGQDHVGVNNTVDLKTPDDSTVSVGIYVNDPKDIVLFKIGAAVEIVYALDELKNQPASDGTVAHSKVALEMAIAMPQLA